MLTGLFLAIAYYFVHPHPLSQTWPLLILSLYLINSEVSPKGAILIGLWSGITLLIVGHTRAPVFKNHAPALPSKTKRWLGLIATAVLSLILYITTLASDILPADNGEFQWVAAQLGLAHPPGFPLYTLLAHLLTLLAFNQSPAYVVNLFSAITSSATLVLVYLTVWRLTKRHLAAATAVIALATSTTFWAQATIANIRSMTVFFAALAIWALVNFYFVSAPSASPRLNSEGVGDRGSGIGDRWLWLFVAALVLGFTHHLSLAFMGLVFVLTVALIDWRFFVTPRRWIRPLLIALLCLLPLLYLPLANNDLASVDGFLFHFFGLGFQGDFFYFIQPIVLWERFKVMGNVFTFQFAPLLLLGMLIGLILLVKSHWKLAILFGGSFAVHTFVTATYRAPQTVEYILPAMVPATLCLGFAVGSLDKIQPQNRIITGVGQLLMAALLLTAVFQTYQHFPDYRQLHVSTDARDYAQNILNNAPPDSIILTNWHWATPLWYLQDVEGMRPDVEVRYIPPGGEAYEQTWAQEIEQELANGRSVIATNYDASAYQNLPPAQPLGEAFLFPTEPLTTLPDGFTPTEQTLNTIQLLGYHLTPTETETGQETTLTLAWQPPAPNPQPPIPIHAHLIGSDGRLYAQADTNATPQADGITLTQLRLTPRPGALPGSYTIRLGSEDATLDLAALTVTPMTRPLATQNLLYRTDVENGRTLIGYDWDNTITDQPRLYLHWQTDGDHITEIRDGTSLDNLPTYLGPWGIPRNDWSRLTQNSATTYVPLGQKIIWIGIPISNLQSRNPKSPISPAPLLPITSSPLPQTFLASTPIQRDYVVSVRLIGFESDNFHWAWCDAVDAIPAMGAMPTLKWIGGLEITSPHTIIYPEQHPGYQEYCSSNKPAPGASVLYVDEAAYNGQTVGGTLILYDAFTKRPLPILDERITAQYQWIPLSTTTVQTKNDS